MAEQTENFYKKGVSFDQETEAIVEAYNRAKKFNNFSLTVRQIIHEWHAMKALKATEAPLPSLNQPYPGEVRFSYPVGG